MNMPALEKSEIVEHDSFTDNDIRIQTARDIAEKANCDLDIADDYHLQFDFDSDADFQFYTHRANLFNQFMEALDDCAIKSETRRSKSGNRHVILTLKKPLSAQYRILIQACMGSDRTREALSFIRLLGGIDTPVLLFKPREVVESEVVESE